MASDASVRRPRVAGSRLFDGEGLPTADRKIIDDGVLTGWTLDLATARKHGHGALDVLTDAFNGNTWIPAPT